jgi:two-component system, sporulation sensor kinase E
MRKFLERALDKVSRMNEDSIRNLIRVLATENERLESVLDSMLDGIIVCGVDHVPVDHEQGCRTAHPLNQSDPFIAPLWRSLRDEEMASFFESVMKMKKQYWTGNLPSMPIPIPGYWLQV